MHYCSQCGTKVKDESNFCQKCGAAQNENVKNDIEKNTTSYDKQMVNEAPKIRNSESFKDSILGSVVMGALIGLLILTTGFGGYYFYTKNYVKNNTESTSVQSTSKIISNDNEKTSDTAAEKNDVSKEYIFYKSSTEKLKDSDIASLDKEKLALARNEIFARHGYIFKDEPFKSYFEGKSWYKPNESFKGSNEELNETEKYNIQLLLKYENKK